MQQHTYMIRYNIHKPLKSYNLNTFSKATGSPRNWWHFAVMKITGIRHFLTRYNPNRHLTLIYRIQYKHFTYAPLSHPNVVYTTPGTDYLIIGRGGTDHTYHRQENLWTRVIHIVEETWRFERHL
jgi:hypothetical protein